MGYVVTLYNAHELAYATCLATCKDVVADKLAEERFCVDSAAIGFHIYKELRDCQVLQQSIYVPHAY